MIVFVQVYAAKSPRNTVQDQLYGIPYFVFRIPYSIITKPSQHKPENVLSNWIRGRREGKEIRTTTHVNDLHAHFPSGHDEFSVLLSFLSLFTVLGLRLSVVLVLVDESGVGTLEGGFDVFG